MILIIFIHGGTELYDVDEAIDFFLDKAITSKNIGYVQGRLDKKFDFEEDYDLEHPDKELKKIFKAEGKLVDEEAKQFNIQIKPLPKTEDAISEFKDIVDCYAIDNNIDNIRESIFSFKKKYSILDPYIHVSFVYEPNGTTKKENEFRSSGDFKEHLTLNRLNYYKSQKLEGYKFKNLEISLKLRSDEEYYRYELNV